MLALLIEAADVTNALYWRQNWGDRDALLARIDDPQQRAFAELNYGPWDRLHDDQSFVAGIGPRPAGAQFYPADKNEREHVRNTALMRNSYAVFSLEKQHQFYEKRNNINKAISHTNII